MKPSPKTQKVENNENVLKNLYTAILKVIAFSFDNMEGSNNTFGFKLLEKMRENVAELHNKYLGKLIEDIEDIETNNSDTSECIRLLSGVISACGFQVN